MRTARRRVLRSSMRSSVELICVDPKRVHEIWKHVEPLLRRASARTGLSAFGDIADEILTGRPLLWLPIHPSETASPIVAAAWTCLQQTDTGKVCVITACGGKQMQRWLSLIGEVEIYAKREN